MCCFVSVCGPLFVFVLHFCVSMLCLTPGPIVVVCIAGDIAKLLSKGNSHLASVIILYHYLHVGKSILTVMYFILETSLPLSAIGGKHFEICHLQSLHMILANFRVIYE